MSPSATPAHELFDRHHTIDADGHWIWHGPMSGGYPQLAWRVDKVKVRRPARLWAWEHAGRAVPDGHLVVSMCGVAACVSPEHADTRSPSAIRIATPDALAARFWKRVDRSSDAGCWPWLGFVEPGGGYGRTQLAGTMMGAHQAAYLLANGWRPTGRDTYVCHHCDNPVCCRPDHLYAGTPTDNARDRVERGRSNTRSGHRHPGAKLTADQVAELRARYAAGGTSYPKLAAEYGIHPQNIGRIIRGEGYAA